MEPPPTPCIKPNATRTDEEKIHVAFILRFFEPYVTGVAVRHRNLIEEIRSRGIEASVHTLMPIDSVSKGEDVPELDEREGYSIRRYEFPGKKLRQRGFDVELFKAARAKWEEDGDFPDVIVVFTTCREMLPSLFWAKRKGIKLVISLTIAPEYGDAGWFRTFVQRGLGFCIYRFFDAVCSLSEDLAKLFSYYGLPMSKVRVFPFPISTRKFRPVKGIEEKKALRDLLQIPENAKVVLFVGSVIRRKGVDLLLKAWLEVERHEPDAFLILAGERIRMSTSLESEIRHEQVAFHAEVENLLQRLERSERVLFTGLVDQPEDYFRASDVFVFPSRLEGMGGVVPEAMGCGLPVVVTPFVGFPTHEFGRPWKEYLLSEMTSESLAEKIIILLKDPDTRSELGRNAEKWSQENFAIEGISERLSRLYKGIVTK